MGERDFERLDHSHKKNRLTTRILSFLSGGIEGTTDKVSVGVVLHGKERLAGIMVLKKIEVLPELPETSLYEIQKKHNWLKKNGFPVVSILRFNEETNEYLMADASLEGKRIVIDKHFPLSRAREQGFSIQNLPELHEELKKLSQKSFHHGDGVLLGSDSYSLILDPETNTAEIVLLDIGRGTYRVGNYQARGRKHVISEEYALKLAEHAIQEYFS